MNQSGRSLLEMLGVVTVIGFMTAGAVTGARFMTDFYQANATAVNIEETANRARDLSDFYCESVDMDNETLCKEKIFAQGCDDDNNPISLWGPVSIQSVTEVVDGEEICIGFSIRYANVPERMCEKLCESLAASFEIYGPARCYFDEETGVVSANCTGDTTMTFYPN